MDSIEFLTHTNNRNLKSQIKIMVQGKLRQINEELNERRLKLRDIFEYENLKYSEEVAKFMRANIEEAVRRRREWLGIHRMERQIEIDKFLQLKKLQREMESCEETRHKQSKALLLDTKQAQLYQVKEKEFVRQKEKEIEEKWMEVGRRYNEEMKKQDNLEQKLVKTIAGVSKESNLRNYECQKQRFRTNYQSERETAAKEDALATEIDNLYRTRTAKLEINKKLHYRKGLLDQIRMDEVRRENVAKRELGEDQEQNRRNIYEILNDHYKDEKQKIHDAVWQDHYINNVRQEEKKRQKESEEFDAMFLGTGCVLQQQNKVPYRRATR